MKSKNNNTIDLVTAQNWAKKWRKEEKTYNPHHELHAFLIPKENLIALLAQDSDKVRAYLGIDEKNEKKLMFVGTKYDDKTNTYVDMLPGKAPEGEIYDYTEPCPPVCDPDSPLNKLE